MAATHPQLQGSSAGTAGGRCRAARNKHSSGQCAGHRRSRLRACIGMPRRTPQQRSGSPALGPDTVAVSWTASAPAAAGRCSRAGRPASQQPPRTRGARTPSPPQSGRGLEWGCEHGAAAGTQVGLGQVVGQTGTQAHFWEVCLPWTPSFSMQDASQVLQCIPPISWLFPARHGRRSLPIGSCSTLRPCPDGGTGVGHTDPSPIHAHCSLKYFRVSIDSMTSIKVPGSCVSDPEL